MDNIPKPHTQSSMYNDVPDCNSSKQISPGKVAKLRPSAKNSQGSDNQLLAYMNANSEQRMNEGSAADAYNGYATQPMSLMVSTHHSGFGGRPADTDGWCNNSSVFLQKGIPSTTLARTNKSRD